MEVLRIATAGSVDDGKSTLIGRLLYDTHSITQDKLAAIEQASKRKGLGFIDLSLLTDGLIAEREQGITIDVAHIYFSTLRRKYIIADTPGHFEYTRNMVTGASNASVSLILIDARNGVTEQTHRHFYIASLLRIPKVLVCVNKMDLVNYSEARFNQIVEDFQQVSAKISSKLQVAGNSRQPVNLPGQEITFIPISSLYGENVVNRSAAIPWYAGKSLLEYLENVELSAGTPQLPTRFPVQYVIRPKTDAHHDFRGYAGRVVSGSLHTGDEITVLPTGQKSRVKTIEKFGRQLPAAHARESVTITLDDDIDISRGNMIIKATEVFVQPKEFTANVCWMDRHPLSVGKTYFLQHGINLVKAKITQIDSVVNVKTLEEEAGAERIHLNDIGAIRLKTARPVFADTYLENPANGAFILIDEHSNSTVGVGFIV